jgi:hypothetical protein
MNGLQAPHLVIINTCTAHMSSALMKYVSGRKKRVSGRRLLSW